MDCTEGVRTRSTVGGATPYPTCARPETTPRPHPTPPDMRPWTVAIAGPLEALLALADLAPGAVPSPRLLSCGRGSRSWACERSRLERALADWEPFGALSSAAGLTRPRGISSAAASPGNPGSPIFQTAFDPLAKVSTRLLLNLPTLAEDRCRSLSRRALSSGSTAGWSTASVCVPTSGKTCDSALPKSLPNSLQDEVSCCESWVSLSPVPPDAPALSCPPRQAYDCPIPVCP